MGDVKRPIHHEDVHLWNPHNFCCVMSHKSVFSINILTTAQRYLSGVQRKTSVSAATMIWGVFGPGGGRLSIVECYVPRKHGWNLAPGQMSILSPRRGWNVFFVGGSVMCWRDEGGRDAFGLMPNFPQLTLGERCICDVNMQGAEENMHLKQRQWIWAELKAGNLILTLKLFINLRFHSAMFML